MDAVIEYPPQPLWDLIRWRWGRQSHLSGTDAERNAAIAEWVQLVGRDEARRALCQLETILASPPEVVCGYELGVGFSEPYGCIEWFAEWRQALGAILGSIEYRLPGRGEWYARWREHSTRLRSIWGEEGRAEPASIVD